MFKFSRKKKLEVLPPEVRAKIDNEYDEIYEQKRTAMIALFDDDFKDMLFRWFEEEMWWEYHSIRHKHMKEYQRNKARKKQKEKE